MNNESSEKSNGMAVNHPSSNQTFQLLDVAFSNEHVEGIKSAIETWVADQTHELRREVAERTRAEHELRKAKIAAEEGTRNYAAFLANMSHELRTPLNAILGFSEMIQYGYAIDESRDSSKEYSSYIHEAGSHLLNLINDLLDLSKINAEKLELQESVAYVGSLIDSAALMIRDRAKKAGIHFSTNIMEGIPPLQIDERRISQAILNLLSNAVKFTPAKGSVTLSAALTDEGWLHIRVSDTGFGMKQEDIPKALTEFGQVKHGLEQKNPSTGLGLPLSKRLIELHGGKLEIDSEFGLGTTVILSLPPEKLIFPTRSKELLKA